MVPIFQCMSRIFHSKYVTDTWNAFTSIQYQNLFDLKAHMQFGNALLVLHNALTNVLVMSQ